MTSPRKFKGIDAFRDSLDALPQLSLWQEIAGNAHDARYCTSNQLQLLSHEGAIAYSNGIYPIEYDRRSVIYKEFIRDYLGQPQGLREFAKMLNVEVIYRRHHGGSGKDYSVTHIEVCYTNVNPFNIDRLTSIKFLNDVTKDIIGGFIGLYGGSVSECVHFNTPLEVHRLMRPIRIATNIKV